MLSRIVEVMARLSPAHHRELVRGMMAELDSIDDAAERARFALGAIAAIARLALSGYGRTTVQALARFVDLEDPEDSANHGGPSMPKLTTRQLLLRHVTPFVVSLTSLTILLLARLAVRRAPDLSARGAPDGTIVEVLVLTVPHTLALTIPIAVFLAVSWVFMRLGAEGVLTSARRERGGVRRLLTPVLGAAAVVAALTLVSNTVVYPRANARLGAVLEGAPLDPVARIMTGGELREAARAARIATGAEGAARAAEYEVEMHKRFALAAVCVLLALAAAAIAIRFPRGGVRLVLGASGIVFIGYDLLFVAGESLADRQLLSPLVAMWMANACLLAVSLLLVRRPRRSGPTAGAESLAING